MHSLPHIILNLKERLTNGSWLWVVKGLSRDPVVWKSLVEEEFSQLAFEALRNDPYNWSPASLALLKLNRELTSESLKSSPMPPVPEALLSDAKTAFQAWRFEDGMPTLKQAGLLAIALREQLRISEPKNGLRAFLDELDTCWLTPLACLYGMVPDPTEMLLSLLSSDRDTIGVHLALHVVFSNPAPLGEQISAVDRLILKADPEIKLSIIEKLSKYYPEQANILATKHLKNVAFPSFDSISDAKLGLDEMPNVHDLTDSMKHFRGLLFLSEARSLAGEHEESISFLKHAQDYLYRMLGHIIARSANILWDEDSDCDGAEYQEAMEAWMQSMELAPDSIHYAVRHATNVSLCGTQEESSKLIRDLLEDQRFVEHPGMSVLVTRLEEKRGNNQEAVTAAQRCYEQVKEGGQLSQNDWVYLTRFLMTIGKLSQAANVVRCGLSQYPAHFELLKVAAEIALKQGHPSIAISSLTLAFNSISGDVGDNFSMDQFPELSDLWIVCLEELGYWEQAFAERTRLLEMKELPTLAELHEFASCAYRAGNFEESTKACREALERDPNDGEAHGLLANTYLEQGDQDAALIHYQRAVRLVPSREEWWLALANLYKRNNSDDEALDTLRAAAQALPDRARVHLALGEEYLQREAPTQALASLRHAARTDASLKVALLLGKALQQLGHIDEAIQTLSKAYETYQDEIDGQEPFDYQSPKFSHEYQVYAEFSNFLADMLIASGDGWQAINILENLINANPDVPTPRLRLVREMLATGCNSEELQNAYEILKPILEDSSASEAELSEARILMAEVYEELGDLLLAVDTYKEELIPSTSDNPEVQKRLILGLNRVALGLEQPEISRDAVLDAIQNAPDDPEFHVALYKNYRTAGQIEEAFQTATTVRDFDTKEEDSLLWFVDQALDLAETPAGMALGAREAAIESLKTSVDINPERGDLILRLGELYVEDGNLELAEEALGEFMKLEKLGISIEDMLRVAEKMQREGFNQQAIRLLQHTLDKLGDTTFVDGSPTMIVDILSELAGLYRVIGDQRSALDIIEECLRLVPDDKVFYQAKADILIEMHNYDEAKQPLEIALRLDDQDAYSHYQMARLEQYRSKLPIAYHHAVRSIKYSDAGIRGHLPNRARLLAAELAHVLLRHQQARAYLWEEMSSDADKELGFPFFILQAELALDEENLEEATRMIRQAAIWAPENPRTMAAQARLLRLQGDRSAGETQMLAAINSTKLVETSSKGVLARERWNRKACYRAMCRGAMDYKNWDEAYYWACRASRGNYEPLSMFMKCQSLASRAEVLNLSRLLDVQHNHPDINGLSEDVWIEFQSAIREVEKQVNAIGVLEGEGEEDLWGEEAIRAYKLWSARGTAAFQPTQENALAYHLLLKDHTPEPADLAGLLLAYIGAGQPAEASKTVRADWPEMDEYPAVMTCLALALTGIDNVQALEFAQSARDKASAGNCLDCPEEPLLDYLVAKLAFSTGDYQLANEAIQSALDIWPDEARWHSLAAQIYLANGSASTSLNGRKLSDRETLALKHLQKAITLESNYATNHLMAGVLYRKLGSIKKAIDALTEACNLSPDTHEPWLELARTQMEIGNLSAAAVSASRAIENASDDIDVLMLNAQLSFQQAKYEDAQFYINTIIELEDDNPQAIRLKADVLDKLGNYEEALNAIEQALPLFGNPLDMQLQQLNLIFHARGYEAALQSFEHLQEQYPNEPELHAMHAAWLFQIGMDEQASEQARNALSSGKGRLSDERHAELDYLMGVQAKNSGQLDQAVHYLSNTIKLAPNHIEALLALGKTYQARRELRQALDVYQRAVDLSKRDYRPYYYAGQVLKDLKNYSESEMMLRQAAKMAPNEVRIHRLLGAVTVLNLVHNRSTATSEIRQ